MFVIIVLALACYYGITTYLYKKTSYYKITHFPMSAVRFNKGRYGEYLTYKYLRSQEKDGARFLFNIYLPKSNGETTEIDVLLVNKDGIFVFESKNYSGWIFGNEKQQNWTQCLPKGRGHAAQKEHFLNPIFQNNLHITTLKQIIGSNYPFYSIIVFSERCSLKSISVSNPMVCVINRDKVSASVNHFSASGKNKLSPGDIDNIYNTLLPFTQVSNEEKDAHIHAIQEKHPEINSNMHSAEDPSFTASAPPENDVALDNISNHRMVCPLCGGLLILRTASRGENKGKQFFGCSNYPKCHYIQNT